MRFWVAADAHERANGRTYMELQIALPRELNPTQREELARELIGDRFAYTMAVRMRPYYFYVVVTAFASPAWSEMQSEDKIHRQTPPEARSAARAPRA